MKLVLVNLSPELKGSYLSLIEEIREKQVLNCFSLVPQPRFIKNGIFK